MSQLLTFDDVLIAPRFSTITSRKDVSLETKLGSHEIFQLPVISSNMDTVTGSEMAMAMAQAGGRACLHRFMSIEDNVKMLRASQWGFDWDVRKAMVSIGLGSEELDRAKALFDAGADMFVIDVAHGAQLAVAEQADKLRALLPKSHITVGNFASDHSVVEFLKATSGNSVNAVKVGVGPGSACTTRIKTGVGVPQFSAIQHIAKCLKNTTIQVIADGGMKTPGDIAKALGAGAHLVMLGGMLAGTDESPGEIGEIYIDDSKTSVNKLAGGTLEEFLAASNVRIASKKYRGSASKESYDTQGKTGTHRTAEGESFFVPYKGPVADVLADIEGGIRSAMTYVGARNLDEFRARCEFIQISPATARENGAHGNKV